MTKRLLPEGENSHLRQQPFLSETLWFRKRFYGETDSRNIYLKAGPAGILIVCSSAEKGTRKLLESFKVLCVPEIQRTGKRVIADVLVVALGDAVLILIENGQKYTFVQKGLFQLGAFLLEFLFRTALVQ